MSYELYKWLHLSGIFMVLFSVSATIFHVKSGGTKESNLFRKRLGMLHGLGLMISLIAGFGLLARLGIHSSPFWVSAKILIWIFFGLISLIIYKKPKTSRSVWWIALAFSFLAAYLAIYKPMLI